MVYSSLQAEFTVTKYDGHIHRYGALVFGKLVIYVSKSIDNNNQINLEVVKYDLIRHAKCSYYIESKTFPIFVVVLALLIPAWTMYE